MKKIFITFFLFLFFNLSFWYYQIGFASCEYKDWDSIDTLLNNCKPSKVVWKWDYEVEEWLKTKFNNIIENISLLIWIIAVWALVYAWFLMQISAWEDEQIKKAKDIIKWTIIGFLLLISAWGIIYIIINFMYEVWKQ